MIEPLTPAQLHACHRWFGVDEVEEFAGNPNQGDRASLDASVDEFGWIDGIVVHRGTVIAGNHRLRLARDRGEEGLPGYDLPGELTREEALALVVVHNQTARVAKDDPKLLAEAHATIVNVDVGLAEVAGWTEPAEAVPVLAPPPSTEPPAPPEGAPVSDAVANRFLVLAYPAETFPTVVEALSEVAEDHSTAVLEVLRSANG